MLRKDRGYIRKVTIKTCQDSKIAMNYKKTSLLAESVSGIFKDNKVSFVFPGYKIKPLRPLKPCMPQVWKSGCLLATKWRLQNPPAMPAAFSRPTPNSWNWPPRLLKKAKGKRIDYMSCWLNIVRSCCMNFLKVLEALKSKKVHQFVYLGLGTDVNHSYLCRRLCFL